MGIRNRILFLNFFQQLAGGACNPSAQAQAAAFGAFDFVAALLLSRREEIVQWACRCLASLVKGSVNVRQVHYARHTLIISLLLNTRLGPCSCSELSRAASTCTFGASRGSSSCAPRYICRIACRGCLARCVSEHGRAVASAAFFNVHECSQCRSGTQRNFAAAVHHLHKEVEF
jgi:hypothetical protein